MNERAMQTIWGKHIKINPPSKSEVYELKFTKGNTLLFDKVQDHQISSLLKCQNEFFYHKITDPPIFYGGKTRFNVPRPFDCFCLVKVQAFLVVWFYKPRAKKVFYKIPILSFLEMRDNAVKKSFREEDASIYGKKAYIN